jgi:Na+/H+ antiporter NhaD/arsenite permease-like protein
LNFRRLSHGLAGAGPLVLAILVVAIAAYAGDSTAHPEGASHVFHVLDRITAAAIFAATYLAVALGRLPGSRLDRSGAAMAGAALMVAIGALSLGQAREAVDFNTLLLLLGMMIIVAYLRLSGFFALVNRWAIARAHRPLTLLTLIVLVAGLLSAFLVNDAVCLVMTPLVLQLVKRLRLHPPPYLLAVAMASNIGSTATITGNPQNMIIGGLSHIPYVAFAAALAPIAAIGLAVAAVLIAIAYPSEFFSGRRITDDVESDLDISPPEHSSAAASPNQINQALLIKSLLVLAGTIIAFFSGVTPSLAAIVGGAILLITGGIGSEEIYREVNWTLLLMFGGLFVVVAGMQRALLTPRVIAAILNLQLNRVPILTFVTAALSNLVSNVPAVLVLKPFVASLHDSRQGWLVVAMAATLAGNFTLLGSVANLIVVQIARDDGVTLSFWDYFKLGAPLTLITIVIGMFLIQLG